ncbi:FadD3 family acyl-CoA ligase [Denitratisoma oestradiolicum]|uniref:3-[(3aS,4S,7aS)-7a-methyl-1, 5-dioxo-octahydro-1H-inden-4-yl]propanoyl:CoA ligase n=1 Tax=Denitratisoma oestradiolicum TaxID=311182 RepID=A0A6S6XWC3_9PROT|nr:FadD3 family acyl-CoA ligase [Denitratisoma oestradiolicum]TWO81350.1 fatty acid--CoA ligase [Denitratisoma oestradiolicum]CAB1368543.1 3-[(3aS,4S,7aS)-7a-methyl-1, 5-dioxo-octahydro-1H-inden-4-yl]propanoyl:CoA ligase [Denitratisoma oestradiolicum]
MLPKILTVPHMMTESAQRWPEAIAIEEGEHKISYRQLDALRMQAARAVMALGVEAGDRVAVWAPNQWEWIVAALGLQTAGAVLVPINTRMKGMEAADIIKRSGAKVLFIAGDFLGSYYPDMLQGQDMGDLSHTVVLRDARGSDKTWEQFMALAEQVPEADACARMDAVHPDSLADLMFTSGTTGRSKGVMSVHSAVVQAFDSWSNVVTLGPGDRYLIINPFFHSFGYKAGWFSALLRGAAILPCAVFDAETVLKLINEKKISFLPGPPTLYLTMLSSPKLKDYDISSLRVAVTGAATIPPVLIQRMRDELGFKVVVTAYGLTECGGCATVCDPSEDAETIATTSGRAIPGIELRCIDEAGKPVPAGSAGEIVIRGYCVMKGYMDDEEGTREAIDSEGWLHTGDVGILDERGNLRITDRLKDMFIVGGFNCYPAEVEKLLSVHPAIAQVAVVGVPDERMGEVGCAFVLLKEGAQLDEKGLIAWSRENMSNYKVPRYVRIEKAFPTNASGKVLKRELRDGFKP